MGKFAGARTSTNRLLLVVFVVAILATVSCAFSVSPPMDAIHAVARRPPARSSSLISHHAHHRVQQPIINLTDKVESTSSGRSVAAAAAPPTVALLLPFLLSFTLAVLPVQTANADATTTTSSATTVTAAAAKVFNNEYMDPLHPMCKRKIEVSKDGTTFHYSGTAVDVGPKDDPILRGCSREEVKEFGLRQGSFDGIILDGGRRISAGDGIHEGVWEPKNTNAATTTTTTTSSSLGYEDVDGIRWNDGNKWVVQSQSIVKKNAATGKNEVIKKPLSTILGEFVIFSYITFSGLAGVKGIVDASKRKQQEKQT